jgi:heme exporter protein D
MDLLGLGKYAGFILSAYGITAVVFALMIVGALNHARRWRKRARGPSDT